MPPIRDAGARRLRTFNLDVLDQALALVAAHEADGAPRYAGPVGAHLRHVIEHYEALLPAAGRGVVDYDDRARDPVLERSPAVARVRLLAVQQRLRRVEAAALDEPLRVRGKGGLDGGFDFDFASTLGRELVFVASHAVHHYALLQAHCRRHGIAIGADFGKAPATVAHERATAPPHLVKEEPPCPAPVRAA